MSKHRYSGRVTVFSPEGYKPKHWDDSVEVDAPSRANEQTAEPIFEFMECW